MPDAPADNQPPAPLQVKDLTVRLGRREVLRSITAEPAPGRVTALVGPNGAGKTTLLRAIAGAVRPATGGVRLDNQRTDRVHPRKLAARLAYVAQRPSIAFGFTVRELVAMGRFGVGPAEDAVKRAIAELDLTDLATRPADRLSVGQQQRAAIARAFAQLDNADLPDRPDRPGWLLLDEPLSALDPKHALRLTELLRERADAGHGVIAALHDLSIAARLADDAIVLADDGTLLAAGPAESALTPETLEQAFGVPFTREQTASGPLLLPARPAASP
ncbi:MAG: ABC transporter ATP-binding protein [Planctomycetota bacterium]